MGLQRGGAKWGSNLCEDLDRRQRARPGEPAAAAPRWCARMGYPDCPRIRRTREWWQGRRVQKMFARSAKPEARVSASAAARNISMVDGKPLWLESSAIRVLESGGAAECDTDFSILRVLFVRPTPGNRGGPFVDPVGPPCASSLAPLIPRPFIDPDWVPRYLFIHALGPPAPRPALSSRHGTGPRPVVALVRVPRCSLNFVSRVLRRHRNVHGITAQTQSFWVTDMGAPRVACRCNNRALGI
jgi:hypothetical protein